MADHFSILSNFQSKVQAPLTKLRKSDPHASITLSSEQKMLVMKMAIKCADIGHTTLSPYVHSTWVESMQEEFYRQVKRSSYAPLTRLLLASYSPLTRLLLTSYAPLTRLLLTSYSPLTRLLLASYSPLMRLLLASYSILTRLLLASYSLLTRSLASYALLTRFTMSRSLLIATMTDAARGGRGTSSQILNPGPSKGGPVFVTIGLLTDATPP
eukprot:9062423-Pyramimonas_sp.AAC.1